MQNSKPITKRIHENTFFKNTLLILLTGFIIKILGLINRIIITRQLGTSGMSLYILSFPTILLFINISGLSLNITTSKLVAESLKNHQYSPKKIVTKAIKLSCIVSFFTILLFIILLKPLTTTLLKNGDLYYPLLTTVILIPLVGISDTLKGYFNGLKQMKVSSMANMMEQIARIAFSIIFLYLFLPYGIVVATVFCLLALSFGEAISILYSVQRIRKCKLIDYENTTGEMNAIMKMSLPATFSRIIGNFTFFLEPIIFTWIFSLLQAESGTIQESYTILNAYTIPLLSMVSFVSMAVATTVIPGVSESYATKKMSSVHYYIQKSLRFSLIPAIISSILLFFFAKDFMTLIYGTTDGASDVARTVLLFIPYYLHAPLVSILQALGKAKPLFVTSTIFNVLRIILIIGLAFMPNIYLDSLLYATIITMLAGFVINFIQVMKYTGYRPSFQAIFQTILLFVFGFFLTKLLTSFIGSYLIVSCIIALTLIFFAFFLGYIQIESLHKERKTSLQN